MATICGQLVIGNGRLSGYDLKSLAADALETALRFVLESRECAGATIYGFDAARIQYPR
jgi:hypothetical protein